MTVSLRILLGYFLVVGLAAYFVLSVFMEEVKPGVRQAMEETLIDTANILAELAAADLKAGRIDGGEFSAAVRAAGERDIEARIWGFTKSSLDYRVYVTDAKGIVLFDSEDEDVGKDYSRWNDVVLTLQGRYGARSTKSDPDDENSTVMHVAAPINDGQRIIGALTVAKPNASVQPFIERGQRKIRNRGLLLLGAAAAIGILFTVWLTRSINALRRYARDVTEGKKTPLPESGNNEIAELGRALAAMRERLEGKQYVEQYVHTLTHELKSPLAAIRGAAELLDEDMPREDRADFIANIREQCERLTHIGERLLDLARVEQLQAIEAPQSIQLGPLIDEVVASFEPRLAKTGLHLTVPKAVTGEVKGDAFLLRHAINNLVDNALDFSPSHGTVELAVARIGNHVQIRVRDHGPGIPEYASDRIFDRFYSLPRPGSGKKSTGLGLPFVREVAALHGGSIRLTNREDGGAEAFLELPA